MNIHSCESNTTKIKLKDYIVYFIENFYVPCTCGDCDWYRANSSIKIRDLSGNLIKKTTGGGQVRLLNKRSPEINRKDLNNKDSESFKFIEETILKNYNLKINP
jgi:hypothetical protein